jgi:hypothetical protein
MEANLRVPVPEIPSLSNSNMPKVPTSEKRASETPLDSCPRKRHKPNSLALAFALQAQHWFDEFIPRSEPFEGFGPSYGFHPTERVQTEVHQVTQNSAIRMTSFYSSSTTTYEETITSTYNVSQSQPARCTCNESIYHGKGRWTRYHNNTQFFSTACYFHPWHSSSNVSGRDPFKP